MAPPPAKTPNGRSSMQAFAGERRQPGDLFWDLITFDRLVTGPVVHIVYWAGLLMLLILGFGSVGAAVGAASHEEGMQAWALGTVFVVLGLLFITAAALIWRGVCEFYVAVFRIADDLGAIRAQMENGVPLPESVADVAKPAPRARKKAMAHALANADAIIRSAEVRVISELHKRPRHRFRAAVVVEQDRRVRHQAFVFAAAAQPRVLVARRPDGDAVALRFGQGRHRFGHFTGERGLFLLEPGPVEARCAVQAQGIELGDVHLQPKTCEIGDG